MRALVSFRVHELYLSVNVCMREKEGGGRDQCVCVYVCMYVLLLFLCAQSWHAAKKSVAVSGGENAKTCHAYNAPWHRYLLVIVCVSLSLSVLVAAAVS
jgi:hypothetical protein